MFSMSNHVAGKTAALLSLETEGKHEFQSTLLINKKLIQTCLP